MNRICRAIGITLAVALSTLALPSSAAALRYCYCEVYCSNGGQSFGQAASRYECSQYFQQICGGSGTWNCVYE